ncbi:Tc toxin subunit A-related protein [Croceimicrobium hydrocarbonivorans]|uniref:Virulence plasmid A protein n=1 Tax=Croceimicrobium hydrocarbonivorans TaxID=2761580 RepID=A0A7H0VFQ7_9FLAO|nr:neuraminidase-like domain-containing protein [Croceimicrobium hydrocarbonivorans]QNR24555.1 hypothetical protein H4K34_01560 [Croceimicrobium hydrocarbonivorans]
MNNSISPQKLNRILKDNPGFDISSFNFLNKEELAKLIIKDSNKEATIDELMAYQRMIRICPDENDALILLDNGLDSCIKICNLNRGVFIEDFSKLLGTDGTKRAETIYSNALATKSKVMHLVASAKNLAGSSFKNLTVNNVPDSVSQTFEDLNSYQDFFGDLDYCDCSECKSILGPAAYLVDLLRIIDIGITQPNSNIPDGLHFFDRRPDIEKIDLTCENTNTIIPYLNIVNEILVNTLESALASEGALIDNDLFLSLANTYFPFNLPFHLPLEKIVAALKQQGSSLYDVAKVLSTDNKITIDSAGKILGLSVEQVANLKAQDPANLAEVLSKNYGLTVKSGSLNGLDEVDTFLQQTGLNITELKSLFTQNLSAKEIFDVSGTYKLSQFGPNMTLSQVGSTITGTYGTDGKIVAAIEGKVMKGQWSSATMASPATEGDIEFTFESDGSSFTGKWSKGLGQPWEASAWNGSLNGSSNQGVIPHTLFINGSLADKQYLSIIDGDPSTIANQDINTLDRLNRFIRLSQLLAWPYKMLNWVLMTLQVDDIDDANFVELAKVQLAASQYGLDLGLLNCMWFDIQTIGVGDGSISQAPFDQLFNTKNYLSQAGEPYHPSIAASATSFVNPLYGDTAFLYVVDQVKYQATNPSDASKELVSKGEILIKGIPASEDDILKVANAVFGDVATIELTVPNLSTLYRHIMLAQHLNISIDQYLLLLALTGNTQNKLIKAIFDRDSLLNVLDIAAKIQKSGFTVYDLNFAINQISIDNISPYVNSGFNVNAVSAFQDTVRKVLQGAVCSAGSFAFSKLTNIESAQVFAGLSARGFIDANGLIIKASSSLSSDDWAVIFIGKYAQPSSFAVNDSSVVISSDESTQIFEALQSQNILDEKGQIIKLLTSINWSAIKIGPAPGKALTKAQQTYVTDTLQDLQTTTSPTQREFITSKLDSIMTHQNELFANQLGAFFNVTEAIASSAIGAVNEGDLKYLEIFIAPSSPQNDQKVQTFLLNCSKILMLQRLLVLTAEQFASVCMSPKAYSLAGDNTYTLGALLSIAGLKNLVNDFGDVDNDLIGYLDLVWSTPAPSASSLISKICALTNWNEQQYTYIIGQLSLNAKGCRTLEDIVSVQSVFGLATRLKTDVYFLTELNAVTKLKAESAYWSIYQSTSSKLILSLQSSSRSDDQTLLKQVESAIEEKKRDALLWISIWTLNKTWSDLKTPENLYEFLMIDPENSGCSEISLIKEALNAAQMYLQRCRLNLEKEVDITSDDIPEEWWEWMMSYRVWQANREIFLYPENYIEPSLRQSKTSLFKSLESTLMQGEVSKDLVESAYVKYLDGFAQYAKLKYVDAYQTIVEDQERGPVDTLYTIARTQEQPYQFYYMTREKVGDCSGDSSFLWSEWKEINIKIDSEHITPVYAFNKLFVFWLEISTSKETNGLSGETGSSTDVKSDTRIITNASIKYSYYNFNGKWIQPQTLVSNVPVNVLLSKGNIYGSFYSQFTDVEAPCWKSVSVINTKSAKYIGVEKSSAEKLIVYFGPLVGTEVLSTAPDIPSNSDSAAVFAFKQMLVNAYFHLEQLEFFNLNGSIPLCGSYVIDETSSNGIVLRQNEYVLLEENTLSNSISPTFGVEIGEDKLAITSDYRTVQTNNSNGVSQAYINVEKGPVKVTADSFIVDPYIDSTESSSLFGAIKANLSAVLDANDVITKAALSETVQSIGNALSISDETAYLIQTRFFELYYGSLILFSDIAPSSTVVQVKNQPNTFIFNDGIESFLLTATNHVIENILPVLQTDAFVSASITKSQSEAFYSILSTSPNNYINPNGTVNASLVDSATKFSMARLLNISNDEADNVITVLKAAENGKQKIAIKDFEKISDQLSIGGFVLSPESFVSSDITLDKANGYYSLLQKSPNNYINGDGTTNYDLVDGLTISTLASLLGLGDSDAATIRIYNLLKRASFLLTEQSFECSEISSSESSTYYGILSTSPNDFILPDGSINNKLVANITTFSIAKLLNLQGDSLAVAKVISVLKSYSPVALAYAYPEIIADDLNTVTIYEHDNIYSLQFDVQRLSTGAIYPISQAMSFGGVNSALDLSMQQAPVNVTKPFDALSPTTAQLQAPLSGPVLKDPKYYDNQQVEFSGPYGLYYWELFFHAPFLVASMLNTNQQFSSAEDWYQFIFNPTQQTKYLTKNEFIAKGPKDLSTEDLGTFYGILTQAPNNYIDAKGNVSSLITTSSPFAISSLLSISFDQGQEIYNLLENYYLSKPWVKAWRFNPFRNYKLQTLVENLTNCAQITEYNDDPFVPDAIARLRIGAYEKTIVMHYIDNLLDWGDSEFRQYSWESITTARMLYTYALDLLGPKPLDLGACEASIPVTFQDIAARYKDGKIPQFLIDMEHLSAMTGTSSLSHVSANANKPFNDLGYYFCIPENDQLNAYWDRVEDRMYKIRHCLNIDGEAQPLPLFQAPINPMDLVRAASQGGNVLSIASQQQQNISNYRFTYLIQQAKSFVQIVSGFGTTLLGILEKSDNEALAMLHLNQSSQILNMTLSVKSKQLEGLQSQLDGLNESLQSAQNQQEFYASLISSGYNAAENTSLAYMQASIDIQAVMAGIQGVSVAAYLAPCIFGFSDGGMKFGDAVNMGSQMLATTAQILTQESGSSQTIAQFQRRAEEWGLQKQNAQFSVAQIQDQIESMQANISSSEQEIAIQKKQIEQNQDQLDFYKSKFTNQELYQWMIGQVSSVYFQAYNLALGSALMAQMAYNYELDREDSFVAFGYWDSLHKGLLAADGLNLALAQLENAYTLNHERRMEIEKTISLKSINPEAFYAFKSGANAGSLKFSLTEELFDRDFPGHYCRRIKSVSVSIPAIVGPYQNIHASLVQNSNMVVLQANKDTVNYAIYATAAQKSGTAPQEPSASELRQNWASSQQVVLSKGSGDSGLFTVNMDDPRYLPFEETGAVSTWTLSMPPANNQIDFSSISDIILSVKYTAKDGGSAFANEVLGLYTQQKPQYQNIRINSIAINQAFASTWYQLFQSAPDGSNQQFLSIPISDNLVLPNLSNVELNQIVIQFDTASGSSIQSNTSGVSLQVGSAAAVPVQIANNRGTILASDLQKITDWHGVDWKFIFTNTELPELCSDGKLDADKLLNITLFISYTSAL